MFLHPQLCVAVLSTTQSSNGHPVIFGHPVPVVSVIVKQDFGGVGGVVIVGLVVVGVVAVGFGVVVVEEVLEAGGLAGKEAQSSTVS